VRNLVIDRAAGRRTGDPAGAVAVGYAAIHATRGLIADLLFRKRQNELVPMLDALLDRLVVTVLALDFQKPGDLTHTLFRGLHRRGLLLRHLGERTAVFDRHHLAEQWAILVP